MTKKKIAENNSQQEKNVQLTPDLCWLKNDLSQSMVLTTPVNSFANYKDIPLYPTFEDIKCVPCNLLANNIRSPYKNCYEYLDIFFRLAREDFVSSIRDTIHLLKKPIKSAQEQIEMKRLWLYENVKIVKTCASSLKTLFFCFDTLDNAKKFDYENSKRFKNGALLIISNDKFETFTLGIVTDTIRLNMGNVGVDIFDLKKVSKWLCIDILEPPAFYEPYRYVLAVLQDLNERNFPMKNYIIYGKKYISPPQFLSGGSTYKIYGVEFDILKDDQWPSADSLQMDINQYEALKGALTKEFSMIQGPPGTGKTYIGLEIVKIIIENLYLTKRLASPIMVVCMTNHALDQFLEGIWRSTKNIARFGYGTKSDILVDYVPSMSIARQDSCADIYVDAKRSVASTLKEENKCQSHIKQISKNIGILSLRSLMEVLITRGFDTWFKDSYELLSWLFYDVTDENGVNVVEFMKLKQFFSSWGNKSKKQNKLEDDVYCITLTNLKQYYCQTQRFLDDLEDNSNKNDEDIVKKKEVLKHSLRTMKLIENHLIKNLKLFQSTSTIEFNEGVKRDSIVIRERWLLYFDWVRLNLVIKKNQKQNIVDHVRQGRREVNKYKSIGYLKPVKDKYVIGMTTTAAARNRYLLQNLECPIVIIEEAAEVLEPHIVASLSEHCKQVILIGDHKQLRPQTANHLMTKKYQLDVSLFERMVNNNIPSYVLAEQHRMRPEISGLVTPAIYPNLRNHSSVLNRPHIRGIASDVFCITHKANEEKDIEISSFKNSLEANFLIALADYLLKQGYYPEDITIMAMYNAQVIYITKMINKPPYKHLKDIRVSSVDGYQGEENEIVLLSLVRSNNYNSVGFLKTNNRVCVALSRARIGFYIVGNLDLLSKASKLWKSIKNYLSKIKSIGPKLLLKCHNHNITLGGVSEASQFKNVFVNCKLLCNAKLLCGHQCVKKCHLEDREHMKLDCRKPCSRQCSKNHKCQKLCYEECNKCEVLIREISLCGHIIEGKCYDFKNILCQTKIKVTLNCGHEIEKLCFEPSVCDKICNKPTPGCLFRHLCLKKCGQMCSPCTVSIPIILICGHISEFKCSQDNNSVVCKMNINKKLPCGHEIVYFCGENISDINCPHDSHKIEDTIEDMNVKKCAENVLTKSINLIQNKSLNTKRRQRNRNIRNTAVKQILH